jgi:uncharacterized protein (TIGR00297 family)
MAPLLIHAALTAYAAASWRRGRVSASGAVAMSVLAGTMIWTGHAPLLAASGVMYVSSTFWTRFRHERKQAVHAVLAQPGPRNALQAVANLGGATLACLLDLAAPSEAWAFAGLASVAAANADSWASEIGALSRTRPVLLFGRRPVPPGISGGVTRLGTLASVGGAATIALFAWPDPAHVAVVTALGFLGCLADSAIGELLQAAYTDAEGRMTERPQPSGVTKGVRWLDNDGVNLLCSLGAGIGGFVVHRLLFGG